MKIESKFEIFLQSLECKELIDFMMFYDSCDIQDFANEILISKLGLPEANIGSDRIKKNVFKKMKEDTPSKKENIAVEGSGKWKVGFRVKCISRGIIGAVVEYNADIWPYAKGIITILWDDIPDPEVVYISDILKIEA